MAGRRKVKEALGIPAPSKQPWFPVIGAPIRFAFLDDNVFDGLANKGKAIDKYLKASDLLRKSETRRGRYATCLAYMGSKVEKALGILEAERRLELDDIEVFAEVRSHPSFSAELKADKNNIRLIDDSRFLVWREALEDLLLLIQASFLNFMSTHELTILPDYKFPTQE